MCPVVSRSQALVATDQAAVILGARHGAARCSGPGSLLHIEESGEIMVFQTSPALRRRFLPKATSKGRGNSVAVSGNDG